MKLLQKDDWHQAGMSDFFCFGGGRGLRKFVSYLRKLGWIHRIVAIVDNRSSLWGSVVTIDEYTWRVISPQELRDIIGNREIIITCMAREELQSQLAGYSELRDTTVAFYQDIIGGCLIEKARHMTFPYGLRSTEKPLIPKIIHYCWFGGAQIPAEFQRYIDGCDLRQIMGDAIVALCLEFVNRYPNVLAEARAQAGVESFYPRRCPEDSRIDIDKTLREQINLLRVVDNERYPAFFEWKGCRYRLAVSRIDTDMS